MNQELPRSINKSEARCRNGNLNSLEDYKNIIVNYRDLQDDRKTHLAITDHEPEYKTYTI